MRDWKSLIVFILITAVAAATGTISQPDAWFNALAKPSFMPPTSLFAPVWSVLYFLMAVAAWRVYRLEGIRAAIVLWFVQLVANAVWTPLFFGLHRVDFALADILALVVLLVATTIAFFRRDRVGGSLLVPYLAWVCFATALTYAIWKLND